MWKVCFWFIEYIIDDKQGSDAQAKYEKKCSLKKHKRSASWDKCSAQLSLCTTFISWPLRPDTELDLYYNPNPFNMAQEKRKERVLINRSGSFVSKECSPSITSWRILFSFQLWRELPENIHFIDNTYLCMKIISLLSFFDAIKSWNIFSVNFWCH